jgi:hypothetical protein
MGQLLLGKREIFLTLCKKTEVGYCTFYFCTFSILDVINDSQVLIANAMLKCSYVCEFVCMLKEGVGVGGAGWENIYVIRVSSNIFII